MSDDALDIIATCDDWYSNRLIDGFHKRKTVQGVEYEMSRTNFAKRCCADDANLCEIISVVPEKESAMEQFIQGLFTDNHFENIYREQLEKISATGTVGAYIYLEGASYVTDGEKISVKGGKIKIDYCDADSIIPLTVNDGIISEVAFAGTRKVRGVEETTLVIFLKENGFYSAQTVVFNDKGTIIPERGITLQLGDVQPFAILTNAEVNNLDNMEGYGLPKIYNSIPLFKVIDLCFNVLFTDLDKAEKMLLVNEILCEFNNDGSPRLTPEQKKLFVLLGEKLPDQKEFIQEYNPKIRIDEIVPCFELALSLISMAFGYGTKKYTFENGQITTATEYIGERQDQMQELNKQRGRAEAYIKQILTAAMWFSNTFCGTSYNLEEELVVTFDDSYVTDRATELERKRNDALSFGIRKLTVLYLMDAYHITEEEALKWLTEAEKDDDEEIE